MIFIYLISIIFTFNTLSAAKKEKYDDSHKYNVIDLKSEEPQISNSLLDSEKFVKRKVAIGRFSNETRYGKSVFSTGSDHNIGKQASDILSAKLAESGKFILLERDSDDMELINKELSMNNIKGLNIPADYLILGSISAFGRKDESNAKVFSRTRKQVAFATVNIRLVDIYSGQIIYSDEGSAEAYAEAKTKTFSSSEMGYDSTLNDKVISGAISKLISNIIENLTEKPWRTFILDYTDGIVTIAGGDSQGINVGDVFGLYQKGRTVYNKQLGNKIELPGKLVGNIEVIGTAGSTINNEISFTEITTNNATINKELENYYIEELK